MKVYLFRHGRTKGNLEQRYIGCRSDEPLLAEAKEALLSKSPPPVRRIYVSPMRRCIETADILYPGLAKHIVEDFRECDFGLFEGRNYKELSGNPLYQSWIDSGGTLPFPGGESRETFSRRCVAAFERVVRDAKGEDFAVIAHGGTVMAVMEHLSGGREDFYHFQIPCGAHCEVTIGENFEQELPVPRL